MARTPTGLPDEVARLRAELALACARNADDAATIARQKLEIIWHVGQGACLFTKRLERGRFIWPTSSGGPVHLTPAQLGYLLEGIDWRAPQKTWRPEIAG